MTSDPIRIKIVSLENIPEIVEDLKIYWTKGFPEIDNLNEILFTDTSKVKMINPTTGIIELPANSTSYIAMPYGWRTEKYLILAEQENGRLDTLNKGFKYKLIRNGKHYENCDLKRGDIIYYDFN